VLAVGDLIDVRSVHAQSLRNARAVKTDVLLVRIEQGLSFFFESNQSRLLKRVFKKDERWIMAPQAAVIIKGEKLSNALLAIFSQCEVIKPRAPSLAVREKSA
jgi:hypothetical protein